MCVVCFLLLIEHELDLELDWAQRKIYILELGNYRDITDIINFISIHHTLGKTFAYILY